jgi:hypothetical protein
MDTPEILECGHPESPHSSITRGWGKDDKGNRYCYACCAERDKEQMLRNGKITLYLVMDERAERQCRRLEKGGWYQAGEGQVKVTNWPGSLVFPIRRVTRGYHNMAGCRYDVWFKFEGFVWHGVQYGDNTQICHCERTKEVAY